MIFTPLGSVFSYCIFFVCASCSEKTELVFKNHFLTILFPVDRYSEMGPSSRTFFSENGFTCLQVLDHIYAFYQVRFEDVSLPGFIMFLYTMGVTSTVDDKCFNS